MDGCEPCVCKPDSTVHEYGMPYFVAVALMLIVSAVWACSSWHAAVI